MHAFVRVLAVVCAVLSLASQARAPEPCAHRGPRLTCAILGSLGEQQALLGPLRADAPRGLHALPDAPLPLGLPPGAAGLASFELGPAALAQILEWSPRTLPLRGFEPPYSPLARGPPSFVAS